MWSDRLTLRGDQRDLLHHGRQELLDGLQMVYPEKGNREEN